MAQLEAAIDIVRVLAISGSLRRVSSNTALLRATAELAPAGIQVSIYGQLAEIPPFNPDLDDGDTPAAVLHFRAALETCDAVLVSSPEYAHGVSGVLKNALDWVVGSGELIGKPIALINGSARATHADASLRETLKTMSARVVDSASIVLPLTGTNMDGLSGDSRVSAQLTSMLDALARHVRPSSTP